MKLLRIRGHASVHCIVWAERHGWTSHSGQSRRCNHALLQRASTQGGRSCRSIAVILDELYCTLQTKSVCAYVDDDLFQRDCASGKGIGGKGALPCAIRCFLWLGHDRSDQSREEEEGLAIAMTWGFDSGGGMEQARPTMKEEGGNEFSGDPVFDFCQERQYRATRPLSGRRTQ